MKIIKLLCLFLLIGCSASKVITDYDTNQDFAKFKTFDFYEDNGESLNEFDVKRITNYMQGYLEGKGLKQNAAPDFYIYFNTETREELNANTIGIGIGSGGMNGGIGVSGGIPIGGKKLNEKLSIRFIEAATNALFWEGSLNTVIKEKRTPDKRKAQLQDTLFKILEQYPTK